MLGDPARGFRSLGDSDSSLRSVILTGSRVRGEIAIPPAVLSSL
jgi:hypothetical protein